MTNIFFSAMDSEEETTVDSSDSRDSFQTEDIRYTPYSDETFSNDYPDYWEEVDLQELNSPLVKSAVRNNNSRYRLVEKSHI